MGHTNRSRWGHTLELRHFHAATSRLGCLGLSNFLCNPTSLVKSIQKQHPVSVPSPTRPVSHDLEVGICGEHGGDPKSIWFCHKIGLNYVPCSPFRIAIARLAATQPALDKKNEDK